MGQDIRKMLADYSPDTPKLESGHEDRFLEKMKQMEAQSVKKQGSNWWKIAAAAVVLIGLSYFGFKQLQGEQIGTELVEQTTIPDTETEMTPQFTMGDLSPDLKKIEDFYLNGINVQLASLEENDENKELIDGYMERLAELDQEYKVLNIELNKVGPTEATITALIDNLKLRLELLFKLKNKLKELKESENEQVNIT